MRHLYLLAGTSLFVVFMATGYLWQALDEEEFPDDELPNWFVKHVRENGLLTNARTYFKGIDLSQPVLSNLRKR